MKRNLVKSAFDGVDSANFKAFGMGLHFITHYILRLILPLLDHGMSKESTLSELNKSPQDTQATVENDNLGHAEDTLAGM